MKRFHLSAILFLVSVIVLSLGLTVVSGQAGRERDEYLDMQRRAIERMVGAEEYIRDDMISLGIECDAYDLNRTWLLGPEFTELTTTPGEEDQKRSSLNPEFAAALVRYYHDAGLRKGDAIAIGSTGSFPGFMIAALTAATEMELDVRLILSLGSSMHGATRVEYNIFHIADALARGGFASFSLLGVSCGSRGDKGGGIMEGLLYEGSQELSVELTKEAAERTGAEFIYIDDMQENILYRMELCGDVKLFVNVGGSTTGNGRSGYYGQFPNGLTMHMEDVPEGEVRGLNYEYAAKGIPVIHLLAAKILCSDNSIPYDPVPFRQSSQWSVYAPPSALDRGKVVALVSVSALSFLLSLAFLVAGIAGKKEKNGR